MRARLNLVYTLSGAMAGLAAVVYLARLNSAEADIGEPLMLPAIAAVLIGGTSLFGGVGSLSGTLVGAVLLTLVLNGMNLLNISATGSRWSPAAIVLARGVDRYRDAPANRGAGLNVDAADEIPVAQGFGLAPRCCGNSTSIRAELARMRT